MRTLFAFPALILLSIALTAQTTEPGSSGPDALSPAFKAAAVKAISALTRAAEHSDSSVYRRDFELATDDLKAVTETQAEHRLVRIIRGYKKIYYPGVTPSKKSKQCRTDIESALERRVFTESDYEASSDACLRKRDKEHPSEDLLHLH